jgi:hypothetical protein
MTSEPTIRETLQAWGWRDIPARTSGKRFLVHRATGRSLGAFYASDALAAVICDAAFPRRAPPSFPPEVPGFTTAGAALRRALASPHEEAPK